MTIIPEPPTRQTNGALCVCVFVCVGSRKSGTRSQSHIAHADLDPQPNHHNHCAAIEESQFFRRQSSPCSGCLFAHTRKTQKHIVRKKSDDQQPDAQTLLLPSLLLCTLEAASATSSSSSLSSLFRSLHTKCMARPLQTRFSAAFSRRSTIT